jgi:hypothetical protein
VGPDARGSKPGMDWCAHMPEKSGIDVCAKAEAEAGAAAAAVSTTRKRKFLHRSILSAL